MLEAALAAGVAVRRRRRACSAACCRRRRAPLLIAPLRVRPRGRHLARRTTRTATTGSSSSAPTASSSPTRPRTAIEERLRAPRRCRRTRDRPRPPAARDATRTTCASCRRASRTSTWRASTSCWTAPTARPTSVAPGDLPPPRRDGDRRSPTSPTGATSTTGCGSTHVDALAARGARRAATTSASPSTATATACWRSTATAPSSTATSSSRSPRCTCARGGRLPGDGVAVTVMTNYGFHTAMARRGHRGRDDGGRRPLRARGAARARLGARRRAVRPHHRHGLRPLRRRHRQRAADARGARRRRPRRAPRDGEAAAAARQRAASPTATPRWRAAELAAAVARESAALEGRGRVLVRPSGTEQLVRVMVEAPTARTRRTPSARGSSASCVTHRPASPADGRNPLHARAVAARVEARSEAPRGPCARPRRIQAHVRHRRLRRTGGPAQELLLAGLQKLEYRGYDSAGISVIAGERDRVGARGRQPRATCATRDRRAAERAGGARRDGRRRATRDAPASATRAGPRTAASTRSNAHPHFDTDRPRARRRQRHRRELPGAQATACTDEGAVFTSRDRRRGHRPPRRRTTWRAATLAEAVRAAYAELEGHYAFVAMSARRARRRSSAPARSAR